MVLHNKKHPTGVDLRPQQWAMTANDDGSGDYFEALLM